MSMKTKREEADIVLLEIHNEYKGKSAENICDLFNVPIRIMDQGTMGIAFVEWEKTCDCSGPYSSQCHGRYFIKLVPNHRLDCKLWSDFLIFHELGHICLLRRNNDIFLPRSSFDYWQIEISCDIFAMIMLLSNLGCKIIDLKNTWQYFSNLGKVVEDEESHQKWCMTTKNSIHLYLDTRFIRWLKQQKEMVKFFEYFVTQTSGSP